jgi:hypothetical protein
MFLSYGEVLDCSSSSYEKCMMDTVIYIVQIINSLHPRREYCCIALCDLQANVALAQMELDLKDPPKESV